MSFWHLGTSRMPRKCPVTLPLFKEKTSTCSAFSFGVVETAVWRTGSKLKILVWAHGSQMFYKEKYLSRPV